jgi:metal-responsive CopG/Arc/MetJ family transcriptional regulator
MTLVHPLVNNKICDCYKKFLVNVPYSLYQGLLDKAKAEGYHSLNELVRELLRNGVKKGQAETET